MDDPKITEAMKTLGDASRVALGISMIARALRTIRWWAKRRSKRGGR